jgi:hypothetical protein
VQKRILKANYGLEATDSHLRPNTDILSYQLYFFRVARIYSNGTLTVSAPPANAAATARAITQEIPAEHGRRSQSRE